MIRTKRKVKKRCRQIRIVLDDLPLPERHASFCWRKHWFTGYDSAYSLFSKFCLLNRLTARELAAIVVTPHRGIKGRTIQSMNADLRDPALFDLEKLAQLCGATVDILSGAFVLGRYLSSVSESSDTLRYCSECLATGFHSPLFQVLFVPSCPLHLKAFETTCVSCGGTQSYRLTATAFARPFSCMHCGHCWASNLSMRVGSDLRFTPAQRGRLEDAAHVTSIKTQFFGSAQALDRHFAFYGRGNVTLSPPSLQRKRDEYYQFIDSVIRVVQPDFPKKSLDSAHLLDVERGTHSGYSRPFRGIKRNGDRKRAKDAEFGWDEKLWSLMPVYRAIRRRLWRIMVGRHRRCVHGAARHIWWDVEGDTLVRLCPVAEAFLSWRMFWEGYTIPQDLFRRPRHVSYGLLGWLSQAAPLCSNGWTANGERWLTHRIFAMDCIRNFHEWVSLCTNHSRRKTKRWQRSEARGYFLTYWLASGGDCSQSPLRVFMDMSPRIVDSVLSKSTWDANHYRWHCEQLNRVRR